MPATFTLNIRNIFGAICGGIVGTFALALLSNEAAVVGCAIGMLLGYGYDKVGSAVVTTFVTVQQAWGAPHMQFADRFESLGSRLRALLKMLTPHRITFVDLSTYAACAVSVAVVLVTTFYLFRFAPSGRMSWTGFVLLLNFGGALLGIFVSFTQEVRWRTKFVGPLERMALFYKDLEDGVVRTFGRCLLRHLFTAIQGILNVWASLAYVVVIGLLYAVCVLGLTALAIGLVKGLYRTAEAGGYMFGLAVTTGMTLLFGWLFRDLYEQWATLCAVAVLCGCTSAIATECLRFAMWLVFKHYRIARWPAKVPLSWILHSEKRGFWRFGKYLNDVLLEPIEKVRLAAFA